MYAKPKITKTSLNKYDVMDGESIEQKIDRIVNNKEPIKDGAPIIFTERKEGILPSFNIRTDRFEIAVEGMDKVHKSTLARREERAKERTGDNSPDATIGGAEPTQGTNS